jgi:oligopeptide transport system substrate-binding protein
VLSAATSASTSASTSPPNARRRGSALGCCRRWRGAPASTTTACCKRLSGWAVRDADVRALLAEAGYPDGAGFPAVELMTFTREVNQLTSEALQQMWARDLGIRVTLVMKEQRVWLDDERQLNYTISLGRWIGDYVDPGTFLDLFTSASGNNATGWADPAYDRLITAAASEPDLAARHALYDEAETLLLTAAPRAPQCSTTQSAR